MVEYSFGPLVALLLPMIFSPSFVAHCPYGTYGEITNTMIIALT